MLTGALPVGTSLAALARAARTGAGTRLLRPGPGR